jgi:hypothetical protein
VPIRPQVIMVGQGPPYVRRAWREATCTVHVVWEPVRETEPGSDLEVRVLWRP